MAPSWNPYKYNLGCIIAIAGEDFAVIGADNRLSDSSMYTIMSSDETKIFNLTSKAVVGMIGFHGDARELLARLRIDIKAYKLQHTDSKEISTAALANLLHLRLYSRRFFPLFVYNTVAGLDSEGKGVVYGYDPVGCLESIPFSATGSGQSFIESFLDNQMLNKSRLTDVTQATTILKSAFLAASERDILTGDSVSIAVIKAEGITREKMELRRD